MMRFLHLMNILTLVSSLIGLMGCQKKTGDNDIFQAPAVMPTTFEDSVGSKWNCDAAGQGRALKGRVLFNKPIVHLRDDILHLSLVKFENQQATLIKTMCLNNITSAPIDFNFIYDQNNIVGSSQYVLSATYFIKLNNATYIESYRPQGFTEIINNGITDKIDITLYAP